jgi:uncharacterized protein YjbI with pentapeptide repeats
MLWFRKSMEAVERRVANGELFEHIDLAYGTFEHADFTGGQFVKCNFSNAQLKYATLERVNFTDAALSHANISDTLCIDASFAFANLRHANARGADLRYTNFHGADVTGVDLRHADLTGSNITLTQLQTTKEWSRTKYRIAGIDRLLRLEQRMHHAMTNKPLITQHVRYPTRDLTGEDLTNYDCVQAPLSECIVSLAHFSENKMRKANLRKTIARYTNFESVDLYGGRISKGSFWRANFYGAGLLCVDAYSIDADEANFGRADMRWIALTHSRVMRANLHGANLSESVLTNTCFDGSDCTNVTWTRADLTQASFAGANLTGAIGLTLNQLQRSRNWDAVKHTIVGIDAILEQERRSGEVATRATETPVLQRVFEPALDETTLPPAGE